MTSSNSPSVTVPRCSCMQVGGMIVKKSLVKLIFRNLVNNFYPIKVENIKQMIKNTRSYLHLNQVGLRNLSILSHRNLLKFSNLPILNPIVFFRKMFLQGRETHGKRGCRILYDNLLKFSSVPGNDVGNPIVSYTTDYTLIF